jgi:c-di-GMP-binding flagellar brake protein YcgR
MEPQTRAAHALPLEADRPSNYAVVDPSLIVHLLALLEQRRALLSAHLLGETAAYGTTLLGVYPDHDLVVLDELNPRTGHDGLLARGELALMGQLEGIRIRFTTVIQEVGSKEGVAFSKCAFPRQLQYFQRRERHRIPLLGPTVPFTAASPAEPTRPPLAGTIHDIYTNGIGLLVSGAPPLNRGDVLTRCTFRLAADGEFRVDLEVRHATYIADRHVTRVGTRIVEPDRPTQRRLRTAIARLEREFARASRED